MLPRLILAAATAIAGCTFYPSMASAGHDPYDPGGYDDRYYDADDGYYADDYRERRRYRRGDYYRGHGERRYRRGDRYARCGSGTDGAIIGGATGALVGRSIGRNGRRGYYRRDGGGTAGAIVGGALGALIGRDIASRC